MGVYARRPFAMAAGMGLNAFVAFSLVAAGGLLWGQAFGLVVLEGIIITLLVLTKFREAVMEAVPQALTRAIAAGIGLFLLFIGLNEGGIVGGNPIYAVDPTVPPVQLGNFFTWTIIVTLVGLFTSLVLYKIGNRGALLIGIIAATIVAIILNALYNIYDPKLGWAIIPDSVVSAPAVPRFFGLDLGSFSASPLSAALNTFALMLSDFFDTLGTFMGLALLAGFLTPKGKLPDPGKPLLVDSIGPILGGAFGSSSATTYIESRRGHLCRRSHRHHCHYRRRPLCLGAFLHTPRRHRPTASHCCRPDRGRHSHVLRTEGHGVGLRHAGPCRPDRRAHAPHLFHYKRYRCRIHNLLLACPLLREAQQDPPPHVGLCRCFRYLLRSGHHKSNTRCRLAQRTDTPVKTFKKPLP